MTPNLTSVHHIGSNVSIEPNGAIKNYNVREERTNANTIASNETQLSKAANSMEVQFAENRRKNEKRLLDAVEQLAIAASKRRIEDEVCRLLGNDEYNSDIIKFKSGLGNLKQSLKNRGKDKAGNIADPALNKTLEPLSDTAIDETVDNSSLQYVPQMYKRTKERLMIGMAEDKKQEINLHCEEIAALYEEANETDDAVVAGLNKKKIHDKYKTIQELIASNDLDGKPLFDENQKGVLSRSVSSRLFGICLNQRFNKLGFIPEDKIAGIINGEGEYDLFENDHDLQDPWRLPIKLSDVPREMRAILVKELLEKKVAGLEIQRFLVAKEYADDVKNGIKPSNVGSSFFRNTMEEISKKTYSSLPPCLTAAEAEERFLSVIEQGKQSVARMKYATSSDLDYIASSMMTSPALLASSTKVFRDVQKDIVLSPDADVFYKNLGVLFYADREIRDGVPVVDVFERLKNRKTHEVTDEVMQSFEKIMPSVLGKDEGSDVFQKTSIGFRDNLRHNFKEYYKDTGDVFSSAEAALYRAFKKDGWGETVFGNGNKIVRYPVEMFYQDELHKGYTLYNRLQEYCKKTFKAEDVDTGKDETETGVKFSVMPDEQTYREVASGIKDPTYAIYYNDEILNEMLPVIASIKNGKQITARCGAEVFHTFADDVFNGEYEVKRSIENINAQIEYTRALQKKAANGALMLKWNKSKKENVAKSNL